MKYSGPNGFPVWTPTGRRPIGATLLALDYVAYTTNDQQHPQPPAPIEFIGLWAATLELATQSELASSPLKQQQQQR